MPKSISILTRAMLENHITPEITLVDVAKATDIQYHTLRRFLLTAGSDMGSDKVEKLYNYLSDGKLVGDQNDR